MLDGGDNYSVANSTAVVDPNPDTIAEFRVLTNNYSAEYGRSNGGIVTVITKSGTNDIHGTAYDYLRNKDLNANNFFNQDNGSANYSPVLTLIRNQFGVTTGGPLAIPKVVNGKDRFFWFLGYQGQRQNSTTVASQVGAFTPAELAGDFFHAVKGGPDPPQQHGHARAPDRRRSRRQGSAGHLCEWRESAQAPDAGGRDGLLQHLHSVSLP